MNYRLYKIRNHLSELEDFVGDYLDFKEFNHVDNILKIIKHKRDQELTDAKLL